MRPQWTVADESGVGRAIYEAVPPMHRPDWASSILMFVATDECLCPEIEQLFEIAIDDGRWPEAGGTFHEVRQLTLRNERSGRERTREQRVLDIAETAAKVIGNATVGWRPFHVHAGWLMAPRVKWLTEDVGEPAFEDRCWRLLIRNPTA